MTFFLLLKHTSYQISISISICAFEGLCCCLLFNFQPVHYYILNIPFDHTLCQYDLSGHSSFLFLKYFNYCNNPSEVNDPMSLHHKKQDIQNIN